MEILGKPTINPVLFYTGKISGYIVWTFLLLSILGIDVLPGTPTRHLEYITFPLLIIGLLLSSVSLVNLGRSARFGLPTAKTKLKTGGLYRLSRNPIYLGFDIITIASVVYFQNPLILALGIYSIVIYHVIILKEEEFLEGAFGDEYVKYRRMVRRYI